MIWKTNFKRIRATPIYGLFLLLLSISNAKAQIPIKNFDGKVFDADQYAEFAANKKIPEAIKSQTLLALSFYPELKNIHIIFRFRKRRTPLSSRPQVLSTFKKKKNRKYVITISTKSSKKLASILFFNLPYNAQIGVLGHELGHISAYNTKNSWQLLGLYSKLLMAKNVDTFEFKTDRVCIAHGLGYQLLDWSDYVRKTLNIPEWRGAPKANYRKRDHNEDFRYMNPETIKNHMAKNPIYKNLQF